MKTRRTVPNLIHNALRLTRPLAVIACVLLLLSCSNTSINGTGPAAIPQQTATLEIQELLERWRSSQGELAASYLVMALELMVDADQQFEAIELLPQVDMAMLTNQLQVRFAIVSAKLDLYLGNPQQAVATMTGPLFNQLFTLSYDIQWGAIQTRLSAYSATGQVATGVREVVQFNANLSPSQQADTHNVIWDAFASLQDSELASLAESADSYELRGWIELARQSRAEQYSLESQIDAIDRWRAIWVRHTANRILPDNLRELEQAWQQRPRHVALMLPLQDQIGAAVQEGFLSAYYQALSLGQDVPEISVFDTTGVVEVRGIFETAINSGADLIIGPLNKELVRQVDNFSDLQIPTLALNYTDFEIRNSSNFYQFGLAPEDDIRQAANLAWQQGYRNAGILYPSNPDYERLQQAFTEYWLSLGGNLVSRANFLDASDYSDLVKRLLAIDESESRASRIESILPRDDIEFVPYRRQDIDFLFMMANPRQGRQINPTLAFFFAGDIPVYALPAIYDGSSEPLINQDLNGIVFTDSPWILTSSDPLKQVVNSQLRATAGPLQRLRALGVDSFRLYSRLGQFNADRIATFNGVSGLLEMQDNGIFKRTPQSAKFENGEVVIIE